MRKIKLFSKRPKVKNPFDRSDMFVFSGIGLASIGLWWIFPPASFIGMGISLIWVGLGTPVPKVLGGKE